jgi:hypothetical protein
VDELSDEANNDPTPVVVPLPPPPPPPTEVAVTVSDHRSLYPTNQSKYDTSLLITIDDDMCDMLDDERERV